VIYSSDLVRASATAEEIAKRLGVKLQLKKEFREKCLGVMEGLTLQEARKKVPDAFDKWRKGRVVPGSEDKVSFSFPASRGRVMLSPSSTSSSPSSDRSRRPFAPSFFSFPFKAGCKVRSMISRKTSEEGKSSW